MLTKEVAGHKSIKTTQRYMNILQEDVVAGLDKMDQEEVEESKVLEFKKNVWPEPGNFWRIFKKD